MVRAVVVRPLPPQGAHGEEALTQGHGAEEAAAQPPRHFQILNNLFCLASGAGLFGFWVQAIALINRLILFGHKAALSK